MSHDYASKNSKRNSGASKNSRAKKATPAPKRGLPWAALLSLILLGGFGYGLYQLAGVQPDPAATQQAVQAKPADPAPAPKKRQPAPPAEAQDEGYRFYTLLPESEVVPPKVEAYNSAPREQTDYSRYLLQAGSFRSATDADALRAKLLLKGLPNVTTSRVTSDSGSVWYRVRVGPFPSRSKLNKAQDVLVRMNLRPLQIKLPKG